MIISNIHGILINDENNDELKEEIISELKCFKNIQIRNIRVIKLSYYYSVFLVIDVNDDIRIKDFLRLERKIKRQIKGVNKLIKFIDVEPA